MQEVSRVRPRTTERRKLCDIILLSRLGGGSTPQTDVLGFGSGIAAGAAVGALEGKRAATVPTAV